MGGKTVNGKTIIQLEKELSVEFPDSDFKQREDGIWYLPIDKYEKRLMDVCGGPLHYSKVCSPCILHSVSGKHAFSVNCKIVIYADDGSIFVEKAANGGVNLVMLDAGTEKERPANLKSSIVAAESDAFKQVCNSLGMGVTQLRRMNSTKFSKTNQEKPNRRQKIESIDEEESEIYVDVRCCGAVSQTGSGRSERIVVPVYFRNAEYQFIVFFDEMDKFFADTKSERVINNKNMRFSCYCLEREFRNQKQLHFRRW